MMGGCMFCKKDKEDCDRKEDCCAECDEKIRKGGKDD